MAETEAYKTYLKNINGEYIVPVSYSAKYDTDGNVIDISELQPDQDYDATSPKPQSGIAVAQALGNLGGDTNVTELASSGTITLEDGRTYRVTPTSGITFTLPTITDLARFHRILVQVKLSIVVTIDVGTNYFYNNQEISISETGLYNLIYEYDNNKNYWVCGLLSKGQPVE